MYRQSSRPSLLGQSDCYSNKDETQMIIADLTRIYQDETQQLNEAEYHQSCYEAGLDDGMIFWNCPVEMEKNIAYHQGYIQALKNKIYDMQYGISPIDPECGF